MKTTETESRGVNEKGRTLERLRIALRASPRILTRCCGGPVVFVSATSGYDYARMTISDDWSRGLD
jgi:hypothetical protein